MAFTEKQVADLSAKLSKDDVKTREQAGRKVSYIEGWHAIAEGNRIFGFDAWDRETVDMRQVHEPYQTPTYDSNGNQRKDRNGEPLTTWRVGYMARVRITVRAGDVAIVRDGCGFGSGIDKDLGQAHESALKESETDAMKRALMTFGNPFGLALYDKTQENVDKGEPPRQQAPAPRQQQAPQQAPQQSAPKAEPPAGTFDWQVPKRPTQIEPTWMGTPPDKTIDWAEWGGKLKHVLNLCTDEREVAEWVKLNRGPLEGLKGEKPKWYAALMGEVTKRETQLRDGAAGARAAAA